MRIRAAVLHEPGRPVTIEEVDLDPPKEYEVLVRVAAVGVCHSDVRLVDGELGDGRWPKVSATRVQVSSKRSEAAWGTSGPETTSASASCAGATPIVAVDLDPEKLELALSGVRRR